MGSGDDQAPAGEVIGHQAGKHALTSDVERIGRLVQQPDRAPDREQPGDREPPALAGRQIRGRQVGGMVEPDSGKALLEAVTGVRWLAAEKIPPEGEIFRSRSKQASARRGGRDNAPVPAMSVRFRRPRAPIEPPAIANSPAIIRNSEVLPDPLRADDRQRLARGSLEIEAREHLAAAPHAPDAASREPHVCPFTALWKS